MFAGFVGTAAGTGGLVDTPQDLLTCLHNAGALGRFDISGVLPEQYGLKLLTRLWFSFKVTGLLLVSLVVDLALVQGGVILRDGVLVLLIDMLWLLKSLWIFSVAVDIKDYLES